MYVCIYIYTYLCVDSLAGNQPIILFACVGVAFITIFNVSKKLSTTQLTISKIKNCQILFDAAENFVHFRHSFCFQMNRTKVIAIKIDCIQFRNQFI